MGRGKVELKRIEDDATRQVTFTKRRGGLVKKAHEISVLCDAEVALIVFSTKAKLFAYSSSDLSTENILERYESYSYAERQLLSNDPDSSEKLRLENSKLKSRIEILQRNQRHYMGEDLYSLSLKELQNLEQQLDTSLKHFLLKKNQLMNESISELQNKERAIQDQNNMLSKKIKAKEKMMTQLQAQWEQQNPDAANTTSYLLTPTFLAHNNSGTYHGEASDGTRRNEL